MRSTNYYHFIPYVQQVNDLFLLIEMEKNMYKNIMKGALTILMTALLSNMVYAKAETDEKPKPEEAICIGWNAKDGCKGIYIDGQW